ncbi:hypothetical protein SDC9_132602 [bioreactor metagenome]|uniref:Uncharacterized protein n=1 Tax=bioreactor metagenome TaxID=1076179 RepID=A0A645D8D8_9ZZZZ
MPELRLHPQQGSAEGGGGPPFRTQSETIRPGRGASPERLGSHAGGPGQDPRYQRQEIPEGLRAGDTGQRNGRIPGRPDGPGGRRELHRKEDLHRYRNGAFCAFHSGIEGRTGHPDEHEHVRD